MTRHSRFLSPLLLLGVIVSPALGAPVEWDKPTISGNVTWSGEIVLRQNVVVSPGATLRILPGTSVTVGTGKGIGLTVLGRLLVEGEERAKVTFLPEKPRWTKVLWGGIRLLGGPRAGHLLSGFRIEGAQEGITLTETSARIANGVFAACETGVRGNQKSQAAVDNCLFEGNDAGAVISLGGEGIFRRCRLVNIEGYGIVADKGAVLKMSGCSFSRGKTGVFSLTDSPFRVENSTFLSLEKGIVVRQAGRDSVISRCSFENNGTAILAVQFCAVEVADSVFRENLTALDVQEFSAPKIHHNRFEANQSAVNLLRKSHAVIEHDVFVHNRNAVVVNYSSYPKIFGNNFDRNDMNVRLEKFQSGDWEERVGSQGLIGAEVVRRGSRNVELATQKIPLPKRIDAKGNYWGPDADRDPVKGTLGKIWDGRKFGPVRYEGFGDAEYDIDVIDFSEEVLSPVPEAGPRGGAIGTGETR
ncbi:MAG: right-handed parallel beta-helix repeat-containing protein [Deltaproteobacteria bacterium]|nr:right-handed parallel beta-helix repeat-containing protein [Deltaproteobacteria bacterium]